MAMIAFNLGNRSDQIVSRLEQKRLVDYFLHSADFEQLGCNGRKKIRKSQQVLRHRDGVKATSSIRLDCVRIHTHTHTLEPNEAIHNILVTVITDVAA